MNKWLKKWPKKRRKKHSLEKREDNRFVKEYFTELTDELNNPGRGWYRIYTFRVEDDFDKTAWAVSETLVLLQINLQAYRSKELDDNALDTVDRILNCFSEGGSDMIIRFAYDFEGKGLEHEPELFSFVEKHIDSLSPLLKKYCSSIYIFQGIFVGSWGEMHTSKFLTASHIRKISKRLKEVWEEGRKEPTEQNSFYRAVRRPVQWRLLFDEDNANKAMKYEKVGLYNDGILGSDTDLGTYGVADRGDWWEAWNCKDEFSFLNELCTFAPNGGEVVGREDGLELSLDETVTALSKRHISYLNRDYDSLVLERWKGELWQENGVWSGINGWDYIGRRLGYRFFLSAAFVIFDRKAEKEGVCFELEIVNTGFSNLYQESELWLEYEGMWGGWKREVIDFDMRSLNSGQKIKISHDTKGGRGKYYLSLHRTWDNRQIFFANPADEAGRVYLGEITVS